MDNRQPPGRWALAFWPGLHQLWHNGSFYGLAMAIVFAALFQLVIFTNLVWPELLRPLPRAVVCFGVAFLWVSLVWRDWSMLCRVDATASGVDQEHLFRSAKTEYLRGNWFQA